MPVQRNQVKPNLCDQSELAIGTEQPEEDRRALVDGVQTPLAVNYRYRLHMLPKPSVYLGKSTFAASAGVYLSTDRRIGPFAVPHRQIETVFADQVSDIPDDRAGADGNRALFLKSEIIQCIGSNQQFTRSRERRSTACMPAGPHPNRHGMPPADRDEIHPLIHTHGINDTIPAHTLIQLSLIEQGPVDNLNPHTEKQALQVCLQHWNSKNPSRSRQTQCIRSAEIASASLIGGSVLTAPIDFGPLMDFSITPFRRRMILTRWNSFHRKTVCL